MVEQLPEEVELLRRELDLLVADARFAATGIDHEVAVLDDGALALRSIGRGAAQDRAHSRDELARVEGLRHVVVGADLEPDDLVDVLVTRREHQHRHVARLPDALADLDAVDVGQHQIQDDESRLLRLDELQSLGARSSSAHGVAGVLQIGGDERRDRRLILDDQHRLGLGGQRSAPYPLPMTSFAVCVPGSDVKSPLFNESCPSRWGLPGNPASRTEPLPAATRFTPEPQTTTVN